MSAVERAGSVPLAPLTDVLEPARLAVVGGSDDEGTERELDSLDLSSLRPRRIDWLWPGYVPLRKVTILDGDPGLGKSTLVLDLAARGSIGGVAPSGDRLGDAFTTIYVTAEDDPEDTILPRLLRAGGDPARLRLIVKLNLPADIGRLRRTVLNHHARLVVIDPLVAYLGDGVKTNDDHNVRRALEPLAVMVAEVDAALVAIRHLNKKVGEDAIYRGGGSIGFTGLARSVLAVGRDPADADRVILAPIKLNVARRPPSLAYRVVADGPYEPPHIQWEGTSEHSAEDLIGRGRDSIVGHSKTAALAKAIRQLLLDGGGEMPASEAMKSLVALGLDPSSQDNLARARAQAGVISEKGGFGGPWMWRFRS
jgi:hypothetical protein